jgi:large subunit ribosomal protein L21
MPARSPAGRRAFSLSGEEAVYAVIRTGGRQYRVQEGRAVSLGKLPGAPGDIVELGDVLLMGDGDDVTVGVPTIAGARVLGTIAEQGRTPKVVVFRYKAKTRSRKKTGHRQHFTRVLIDDILAPGQEPKPKKAAEPAPAAEEAPAKGRRRRRTAAEATEETTATAAPAAGATKEREPTAEPTVAEEQPAEEPEKKPRRSRRKEQ